MRRTEEQITDTDTESENESDDLSISELIEESAELISSESEEEELLPVKMIREKSKYETVSKRPRRH